MWLNDNLMANIVLKALIGSVVVAVNRKGSFANVNSINGSTVLCPMDLAWVP